MKYSSFFYFTILLTIMACLIPGINSYTPIPTMDINQIPTMVVLTAQAMASFSVTPTSFSTLVKDISSETPAPASTLTLTPIIGEAVSMQPFVSAASPTPLPAESVSILTISPTEANTSSTLTAVIIAPTSMPTGCQESNISFEARVTYLINAERAKAGLNTLSAQAQLVNAAQLHSTDMACNNYFGHIGLDGSNGGNRILNAGYAWIFFGENIAAGHTSPDTVVQAWMNSPSHKANILGAYYTEIGAGYAYSANNNYGAYWTVLFGNNKK